MSIHGGVKCCSKAHSMLPGYNSSGEILIRSIILYIISFSIFIQRESKMHLAYCYFTWMFGVSLCRVMFVQKVVFSHSTAEGGKFLRAHLKLTFRKFLRE